MTTHARGTFEVKLTPQDDKTGEPTLGRMTIDKQIHGDLEGTSKGQMFDSPNPRDWPDGQPVLRRISDGHGVRGFGGSVAGGRRRSIRRQNDLTARFG